MRSNLEKKSSVQEKFNTYDLKRLGLQTEAAVLLNTMKNNEDSQLRLIITKEKRFSYLMCTIDIRKKST